MRFWREMFFCHWSHEIKIVSTNPISSLTLFVLILQGELQLIKSNVSRVLNKVQKRCNSGSRTTKHKLTTTSPSWSLCRRLSISTGVCHLLELGVLLPALGAGWVQAGQDESGSHLRSLTPVAYVEHILRISIRSCISPYASHLKVRCM